MLDVKTMMTPHTMRPKAFRTVVRPRLGLKGLALWVGLMVHGCRSPEAPPPVGPAEAHAACEGGLTTRFSGGPIWTMDPERPSTEVLAVRGDRIVATQAAELAQLGLPEACIVDVTLEGGALLPGFIDSHVHVRELGMDAIKADLVGVGSVEEMVERLQVRFPDPKPGAWLIGQGWDEGAFASAGYPDREALDAAFPDNPVALESLHGFAGMYNAAALRVAGVETTTPDPEGGTILRREDGAPTGVMLALAQGLVNVHRPPPDAAQLEAAIAVGLRTLGAAGITSVHEAGMKAADVAAFERMAERGELPLRVYGLLDGNDPDLMGRWFERGPYADPGGRFDVRGIKIFYDGSLGSRTAVLSEPYADRPDAAAPAERMSPERMGELAGLAVKGGFQLAVHAIGDEANHRTLDVFEAALAEREVDARWRIEHAQVVHPHFYARAAKLGVIASMQPSHAVGDSRWAQDRLGLERVEHAYAWRRMLDAGVRLILNSDLPGEPWTPVETLYFAVNRRAVGSSAGAGWRMDQAVTVGEALAAMTREGAYAAFADGEIGILRVGMKADLVILDADPFAVAAEDLAEVRVRETWIDGERLAAPAPGPIK